jgi:hypothetical protein
MVACFGIWKLFNDLHDSHRILEKSFFYVTFGSSSFPIQSAFGRLDVRPARNALKPV